MKRRSIFFPLLFFALSLIPAFSEDIPVLSRWSTAPPALDGLTDDWREDVLSSEKGIGVDYAFRNDERNLYILFVFKEPKSLSTVDVTGMTIFFSPSEKKQKDYGVRFRKKNVRADELIAMMEKSGQELTEERKREIRKLPMYVLYQADAINKKGEVIPSPGPAAEIDPPSFRFQRQGKTVIYEFRVPLVSRESHPAGAGGAPGELLKVGFEWGGLTEEMKKAMASGISADSVRAGASDVSLDATVRGGDESEGLSRGMSRSDASPELARMRRGPKKYSFWADVRLARSE